MGGGYGAGCDLCFSECCECGVNECGCFVRRVVSRWGCDGRVQVVFEEEVCEGRVRFEFEEVDIEVSLDGDVGEGVSEEDLVNRGLKIFDEFRVVARAPVYVDDCV